MMTSIINWALALTQDLGYPGILILMAIESSFLPLPSEIIIPPAAYLASLGKMNLALIILVGIVGSVIGAGINYMLSFYLGRPAIYRLARSRGAHLLFITPGKIERAEKYFLENSRSATFVGRLIPVVRHLISIPAGFSRMPVLPFLFYTPAGSAVWVSLLAGLGYFVGANQELLSRYYKEISWGLLLIGATWIGWKVMKAVADKD